MRFVLKTMMFLLLATPAFAQAGMNMFGQHEKMLREDEVKEKAQREDAFKSGVSKIPTPKTSNDPWGAVRAPAPAGQKPPRESSK
jgi:hypothetical protein